MTVGFHRQCAAVAVTKPAADSRNIYACLNAARRKQVSQVVMRDAREVQEPARAGE